MSTSPQQNQLLDNQVIATKRTLAVLDKIGSCASLACAVHCIALPFLITVLPLIGLTFFASSSFEFGMIAFTISLATLSFCWGTRLHGEWKTLLFVLAALMLFVFGHEIEGSMHWVAMAVGGVSLATGHFMNKRLCASCQQCCHH